MSTYLFVYGSLKSALAHPMGEKLRREARLMGAARVAGRLHRVSWYPGLRPAASASDVVHGEVYLLTDPEKSLHWLDEYEGLRPGGTSAAAEDEYSRALRLATLADGTTLLANVYLYQRPLPISSLVPDGVWRG